jgi:23S rRNA (cytosine1962-C5)-methyltransferase
VTDGYRLIHAEGDGVPGLILDRLGDVLVAQVFALCAEQRLEEIGARLKERYPRVRLALTVDDTARKREGLRAAPPVRGLSTIVTEHDIRYRVDAGAGHKTGFFADQRDNRLRVRELARGRKILDACCNAGGFALNAARGGARRVVAVDLDEAQVARTRDNAAANRLQVEAEHADAFAYLRDAKPGQFDLIVLDPPKWAAGKSEVEAALKRYTDLNRLALEKLPAGGLLLTCSCSGAVSEAQFARAVRDAAAQAGRDARVLGAFGAGPDHPVALECPETRYLKVLLLELRA